MTNKTETKLWMNIYIKPANSKKYMSFSLNYLRSCFNNILFLLVYTIVEGEKKKLKQQKYPTILIKKKYKNGFANKI